MTLQSARTAPAILPLGTRIVLLVGLLFLGAAFSQVARAATDAIVDCNQLESSLRSLEVSVDQLPTDPTDALDADSTTLSAAGPAPVLRLTPRVATIMREIFDALPIIMLDENGDAIDAEDTATVEAITTVPDSPPIVNAPAQSNTVVPDDAQSGGDDVQSLPRFQRYMYRTDI